jgi:cytochrome c oxidase cbb3-type subunit III
MRRLFLLAPLLAAGCGLAPVETASEGAPPAIVTPIGPLPGPGQQSEFKKNPFSGDQIAMTEGRKLFLRYNCYGCHGGRAGGGMGPSLRDPDWIYGNSEAHIFSSIVYGRAHGMPAWGTKVPENQVWQLVSYIKSLRTPLEPDPPKP